MSHGRTYPERPRFFAMKFLRLLNKTAAAQTLGADACWLLTIVVTTEDVAHYRRGVTYFNEQLMSLLGLTRWHTFNAIRARAVESGWLHYEAPPSGVRGKPGVYWVTIPAEAEGLPDNFQDEGAPSTLSVDAQQQPSSDSVDARVDARVYGGVDACVEPSYPIPNPTPTPNKKHAARATARFVKPTAEQISEFCASHAIAIDVARFLDHYDSNGWRIGGKTPMRDWRAAVRNWHRNDLERTKSNGNGKPPRTDRVGPGQKYDPANRVSW